MAGELAHVTVGTELTQAEYEGVTAHQFNSQATGDIGYASSATQLTRLAIGAANAVLNVSGGIPAWTATPTLTSLTSGAITLSESASPGAGVVSVFRDNTGDQTFNVLTGKQHHFAVNGVDLVTVGLGAGTAFLGVGAAAHIVGYEAEHVISATTNVADNKTAGLVMQGGRDVNGGIAAIAVYNGSNLVGSFSWVRDSAADAATFNIVTKVPSGAQTTRMTIGTAATATVTWAACTHTGFVATNSIRLGTAGSALGTLNIAGNTSGVVSVTVAAVAGTWTMTLPSAANTNAGYQLTCAGADSITSWAAAACRPEDKNYLDAMPEAEDSLDLLLGTEVRLWHYKPGRGTGDTKTEYVGPSADKSPGLMHYDNGVLNPISGLGHTILAIQAMQREIDGLKAELAEAKGR